MAGWTLGDIPWGRLDRSTVTPDILSLVKAASLVEANAADYRDYLHNVFAGDNRVCRAIEGWAAEEEQHGAALARWAMLIDPAFSFETSFQAFITGYRIPIVSSSSVRGSRCAELIARCMVEIGTHSFYTALSQATNDPVLTCICRHIADDELAHFNLFYRHMRRYLETEKLGLFARFRVAVGRLAETDDDELAFAFYAANNLGEAYDCRFHGSLYHRAALAHYSVSTVGQATRLFLLALNVRAGRIVGGVTAFFGYALMAAHRVRLATVLRLYGLSRSESRRGANSSTAAS